MSNGILRDQSSHASCVTNDMCTSGVSGAGAYSTISDVDQALQVPLGSQLQLLEQQYAGNPYFNYSKTSYKTLPPSLVGTSSYSALTCDSQGSGGYCNFQSAYGTSS